MIEIEVGEHTWKVVLALGFSVFMGLWLLEGLPSIKIEQEKTRQMEVQLELEKLKVGK